MGAVKLEDIPHYTYDDYTLNLVICHQPRHTTYLTKAAKIIFEIFSKSTATKDKNLKYKLKNGKYGRA